VIKLGMKGLAKYMIARDAQKRKILRDYKFPDPEGNVQAIYYREARDFIIAYHKNGHDPEWLDKMAMQLRTLASSATGQAKTRYRNNASALEQYRKYFSKKKYKVLPDFKAKLYIEGVFLTIIADLHVQEGKSEKIIKLEFTKKEPPRDVPKIICQLMYEAAIKAKLRFKSNQVLCFDVPRGTIYKDARAQARMMRNIEAACKNIGSIWNGIDK